MPFCQNSDHFLLSSALHAGAFSFNLVTNNNKIIDFENQSFIAFIDGIVNVNIW